MSFLSSTLKTATSLLRVIGVTLAVYAIIVAAITVIPFGGVPVIRRLLPLQNPGGPSYSLTRFRETENKGPVDIVFLGASHTYRGFDPRLFEALGYSSQNLGSSSQTPLNTVALLQRHLDHLKPKLVIYEIFQTTLSIDGMESYYDLLSNTPLDSTMVEMTWNVRQPQAWTALLSTAIRNYRTPFHSNTQYGKEGRDDVYIEGGYVQCTSPMPLDRLARIRKGGPPVKFSMDPRQFQFLSKCIDLARDRGITFVACSYPITVEARNFLYNYKNNQEEISQFLLKKGVLYRDFNLEMTLDTASDFFDEVHLNQQGVEKFDRALITWLEGQGVLPTGTHPAAKK